MIQKSFKNHTTNFKQRALSSSIVMMFHFLNQYANSRAVPNMLLDKRDGGLGPAGTFWLFSVVTLLGGIWVWFFVPETAGRSLESMDNLFRQKWYRIGRFGQQDAVVGDVEDDEKRAREKKEDMAGVGYATHVETIVPKV